MQIKGGITIDHIQKTGVFINQTLFYRQVIFCYPANWGHLTRKADFQVKNRPALDGGFFSYWNRSSRIEKLSAIPDKRGEAERPYHLFNIEIVK